MQQIEHRVFLVGCVSRWCVDIRFASRTDGFRFVFDHLQLAVRDTLSNGFESFWRSIIESNVIWAELDRATETTRPSRSFRIVLRYSELCHEAQHC